MKLEIGVTDDVSDKPRKDNDSILVSQNFRKNKRIRRSKMYKRITKQIKILYSNIQGFTGKKNSIQDIMRVVDCDVCLLTETMTTNIKINGATWI